MAVSRTRAFKTGKVVDDYALFGVDDSDAAVSSDRLRLFVTGPVGEGKTSFCLSRPNTAVFDVEAKTGGLGAPAEGTRVFGRTRDARTGHIRSLNYAEWLRLVEQLCEDAAAGKPKFTGVAIDPVDSFIQLIRFGRTQEVVEKTQGKVNLGVIGDITGYRSEGAGWDMINSKFREIYDRLYQAGYGLICTSHLTPRYVKVGNNEAEKLVYEQTLNGGVLRTLRHGSEYIGKMVRLPKQKGGGFAYTLSFDLADKHMETRQQVPLVKPLIVIPKNGGWARFDKVYKESVAALNS